MEAHPDEWSSEMLAEYEEYTINGDLDPDNPKAQKQHDQARELYDEHLLRIKTEFFELRCWPCIEQGMECDSKSCCNQCLMDGNENVCEYMQADTLKDVPLPFHIIEKKDNQELLDLAMKWKLAATRHLELRLSFQLRWPGAWHFKEGPNDTRTTQEGHLTKLNNIKQEICAITGRVIDHLAWRDKEIYAERAGKGLTSGVTDIEVKYNGCTEVSHLKYEGKHQFPSTQQSSLRRNENRSDPKYTEHLENLPWNN